MPQSKKNITLHLMNQIAGLKTPKATKNKSKRQKMMAAIKKSKKTKPTKSKKTAKVGRVKDNNSTYPDEDIVYQARIGDKTRSARSYNELGIITEYDRDKDLWITNTGRKLKPSKQDKSWEIVYYRIYVLSLRPKPTKSRKYLPEGWPFNTSVNNQNNNNEESSSSGTNENNVDLLNRNSNELESSNNDNNNNNSRNNNSRNNDNDIDDRKLYMCVVSAPNPESARQFILDNDLYGVEDCDENGEPYKNSIWLDEYLSSCKDVGESFHQESMLLCINRY